MRQPQLEAATGGRTTHVGFNLCFATTYDVDVPLPGATWP